MLFGHDSLHVCPHDNFPCGHYGAYCAHCRNVPGREPTWPKVVLLFSFVIVFYVIMLLALPWGRS
jgi:hypothetical protein